VHQVGSYYTDTQILATYGVKGDTIQLHKEKLHNLYH